jgi:hypothetical protein
LPEAAYAAPMPTSPDPGHAIAVAAPPCEADAGSSPPLFAPIFLGFPFQRRCWRSRFRCGASPGQRLAGILSNQPGRYYRCTNTLSIVHTGRPISISSAKITHATMNVVWLDGERSARFPLALPMSRHQKPAGMGSVSHTWALCEKGSRKERQIQN